MTYVGSAYKALIESDASGDVEVTIHRLTGGDPDLIRIQIGGPLGDSAHLSDEAAAELMEALGEALMLRKAAARLFH